MYESFSPCSLNYVEQNNKVIHHSATEPGDDKRVKSMIHENRIADMPLSTSTLVWQRCLPGTFLPRVSSLKDRVQLLKRPPLRFDKEEVDEHKLEQVPEYEEDVATRE